MVSDGFSLMQFHYVGFFSSLTSSSMAIPNTTDRLKICESLITSEPEPDEEVLARLDWLYKFTNKEIRTKLPIIEMVILKNINRGLEGEIDVNGESFKIGDLYAYVDEVDRELAMIVTKIAKKYNLDVPLQQLAGLGKAGKETSLPFD